MSLHGAGALAHGWIRGVPLIALTVAIHGLGPGLTRQMLGGLCETGPARAAPGPSTRPQ